MFVLLQLTLTTNGKQAFPQGFFVTIIAGKKTFGRELK
jgi:hypothetical protein